MTQEVLKGIHSSVYVDHSFLDGINDYFVRMVPVWSSGVQDPTPADELAYFVLKNAQLLRVG